MAKCPICNSRKGKRECLIQENNNNMICSLCCAEIRQEENCFKCEFYKRPKRQYNEVPAFSTMEMQDDFELISYANSVEGALCAYDNENKLSDSDAIRIIEMVIDKYYFNDQHIEEKEQIIINGFNYVKNVISLDLEELSDEKIVKLLSVIRFVAARRTRKGREYIDFIHENVGVRIAPGVRML